MKFTLILVGLVSVLASHAAEPKIGCAIAFRSGYGAQMYISNATFKERPAIETMAKEGLDVCLCNGWKGGEVEKWKGGERTGQFHSSTSTSNFNSHAVEHLKQFNAIWLIVEHEDQCPYPAAETIAALKAYVAAGGGLVICHSAGRYSEAPVDKYWTEVYAAFGLELLHEETVDPTCLRPVDTQYEVFHLDRFADHPVTKGLTGLWLPNRLDETGGVTAFRTTSDWTTVVATTEKGRSFPKNPITNLPERDKPGTYAKGPVPIVAVRSFGKGRIVFEAIHKDMCGWNYNLDRWPNIVERGVFDGKPGDTLTLLENALKWAAEPSMGIGEGVENRCRGRKEGKDSTLHLTSTSTPLPGFVTHYKPVEPDAPAYRRGEAFGKRWEEKAFWPVDPIADWKTGATGLIGLHSNHSDGKSTVAEYVAEAKRLGLNFLVFTDPLEKLGSAEALEKLRADCVANSSDGFYCCPGVEYTDQAGFEWLLFTDKVSFPQPGTFHRDGRDYLVWDGKRVLQRNQYAGKNLYRGALLNMPALKEKGAEMMNMFWFNEVIPVAYDVDRPLYDNRREVLETPHCLFRTATVSYTRCRTANDLKRAAAASVTCARDLAGVREMTACWGQAVNEKAVAAHAFVRNGRAGEIRDFSLRRVPGTDVMQCAVSVACEAGLKEVRVVDGARRTVARFDAKGAKAFSRLFTFEWDAQMYPQLIVTCADDGQLFSQAKWLAEYHAGLNRCGDNANLLPQNPNIVHYPNWDTLLSPPYKFLCTLPAHHHVSESSHWVSYATTPSREPSARIDSQFNTLRFHGLDYPSEAKHLMPSSREVLPLVMPNVVAIVDQIQGETTVEPTRSDTHGSFSQCCLPVKVGENPHWRFKYRTYQFSDRIDGWWRAVYYELAPDYRGGFSIVEAELEILEDASIAQPLTFITERVLNPKGTVKTFRRNEKDFRAGSYYAACASSREWHGYVGLAGTDPLNLTERTIPNGVEVRLMLLKRDQKVKRGDKFRARFAIGSFMEDPHGGEYMDWFAGMMDGSRFVHEAVKGTIDKVDGILDLTAREGVARAKLGPTWFIQNYPVRVRGLVDNGSAFYTDGNRIVKPMAFCEGKAYAEVPLEEGKTWTFMNRYLADDPALRFTYVLAMPNHMKETVQILNNTKRDITSKVRNLVTGESFTVIVPAGGMIVR